MVRSFRWIGRAHRGLRGDHLTASGTDLHPKGRSEAEDGGARLFCFAMQRREAPAENNRVEPLQCRSACRPIAL
jgi:hypothetical protein